MANDMLVDTSVFIDIQKGNDATIKVFDKLKDKITISRVTAYELIYGARNKKEKELNKEFLENFEIVEVDEAVSKHAYVILDKYALAIKLGIIDSMIASTSIIKDLPLWTLNTRHFKIIKELNILKL